MVSLRRFPDRFVTWLYMLQFPMRFSTGVFLFPFFVFCNANQSKCEEVTHVHLAPHHFTIPEGYELTRVAGPPLVQRPIHMCFDVNGDLYVTDSSGNTDKAPVQRKNPQHRVLRLIDRDGDGIYDQSNVFADELPFPEGILVHEGSVYVGAPPHIWKLRDTDGDHCVDERTIWFDGGSIGGCGNDMHGPYLGVDGFFYWCKGAFEPQEHELTNARNHKSFAAHLYRARPDGTQLERVITGGMNNPVGLAFNETGEKFLSGTFFDLSMPGRRDGILHAVYGGMYGRQNPRVLKPHPNTVGLLPILSQLGPAAPSGMLIPRNTGSGIANDLICTEFNTRRVSRHRLSDTGSSYSVKTQSLLESDHSDFHPTDVIEDADGSLLIADTGSWYMICCPTSKIAKPNVLGSIYRIKKKDAPVQDDPAQDDPRGLKLDWSTPQVGWLNDKRPAVVKRAIDQLGTASQIDALLKSDSQVPKVWAIHRIDEPEARRAIRDFLLSESKPVQIAAIHSVALWRDLIAFDPLIHLLSDTDPKIQRLAAMALGRLGQPEAVKPLLDVYHDEMDAFQKHAITYAVYEIAKINHVQPSHPVVRQVRRILKNDQQGLKSVDYPKIQPAKIETVDPVVLAYQKRRLQELTAFLANGDESRGKKLFDDQSKSKCVTCHLSGEVGTRLGPDLTGIGSIRSERDLLEAIIFPDASIVRYHETINVLTKNDDLISGLLVKETDNEMFLSSAEGAIEIVRFADIRTARYSNVSLMPKGFDQIFTPQEIADLVAYLKSDKL